MIVIVIVIAIETVIVIVTEVVVTVTATAIEVAGTATTDPEVAVEIVTGAAADDQSRFETTHEKHDMHTHPSARIPTQFWFCGSCQSHKLIPRSNNVIAYFVPVPSQVCPKTVLSLCVALAPAPLVHQTTRRNNNFESIIQGINGCECWIPFHASAC